MSPDIEIGSGRRGKNAFVDAAEPKKEPMKRLTLDIGTSLHADAKSTVARRGTTLRGEVLEMMEARYQGGRWPAEVVEQVTAQLERDAAAAEAEKTPPTRRRGK